MPLMLSSRYTETQIPFTEISFTERLTLPTVASKGRSREGNAPSETFSPTKSCAVTINHAIPRAGGARVFILLLTRFGETKPFCADHTRRTDRKGYPANSCDRSGHPQRARTGRHRMADGRELFED